MTEAPITDTGPLAGIRVLSMAEQYPGPFATRVLADLGAEVIQIERPATGDPARAFASIYTAVGGGKKSVCLDLKDPDQRAAMHRLIPRSDIFVEGFRPGVVERLGLSYAEVSALNPAIVYVSISSFGQDGPYRDRIVHDLSIQAMLGLYDAWNPDNGPVVPLADLAAGSHAVFAALSCLIESRQTGRGRYVDISMADSLASFIAPALVAAANRLEPWALPNEPAYRDFTCRDGTRLTLSIAHEDHMWTALCGLLGFDDVATYDQSQRLAECEQLTARLREALALRTRDEWITDFIEHGIPHGPVLDFAEVSTDPHLRRVFASPDDDAPITIRSAIRTVPAMSDDPLPLSSLGDHTDEVLAQLDTR